MLNFKTIPQPPKKYTIEDLQKASLQVNIFGLNPLSVNQKNLNSVLISKNCALLKQVFQLLQSPELLECSHTNNAMNKVIRAIQIGKLTTFFYQLNLDTFNFGPIRVNNQRKVGWFFPISLSQWFESTSLDVIGQCIQDVNMLVYLIDNLHEDREKMIIPETHALKCEAIHGGYWYEVKKNMKQVTLTHKHEYYINKYHQNKHLLR